MSVRGLLAAVASAAISVAVGIWVWAGYLRGSRWEQAGTYSTYLNIVLAAATVGLTLRLVWTRRDRLRRRPDNAVS